MVLPVSYVSMSLFIVMTIHPPSAVGVMFTGTSGWSDANPVFPEYGIKSYTAIPCLQIKLFTPPLKPYRHS